MEAENLSRLYAAGLPTNSLLVDLLATCQEYADSERIFAVSTLKLAESIWGPGKRGRSSYVNRMLKRLESGGLIQQVRPAHGSVPAAYRLVKGVANV